MNTRELYRKLYFIREELKNKFESNGRKPNICSDESLYELAQKAPRQKSDLLKINGLGQTFHDKYGDYFMVALNEYHLANSSQIEISNQAKTILKSLENRLVNISHNNRLLYARKTNKKQAYDLISNDIESQAIVDLLMGKIHKITLVDASTSHSCREKEKLSILTPLIREVSKDYRESGQYDLYIAYPYVMGKTRGEDFNVRAPLALFPIVYDKHLNKVTISLDKNKDILYNTNLILMQNKFLGKGSDLPNCILEDFDPQRFINDTISFYESNNIKINITNTPLKPLGEITTKDFSKYQPGEFELVYHAILGKFSLCSTALQKDFSNITNSPTINPLVNELIIDIDNIDHKSDDLIPTTECSIINQASTESDLHYINDLNDSQAQCIIKTDSEDKLVIQGPPGTGKSQTITSLIADKVSKGHNILVVSQKKAALDVIYSRLGNLNKYAVMLNDTNDKLGFYNQVHTILTNAESEELNAYQFNNVSSEIDAKIKLLDLISQKLYTCKINKTPLYKYYQSAHENFFINNPQETNYFFRGIFKDILNIDYHELLNINKKFQDSILLNDCYNYIDIAKSYPWLKNMREDISLLSLQSLYQEMNSFAHSQSKHLSNNFIKRIFTSLQQKKSLKNILSKYFVNTNDYNYLYKAPDKITSGIERYVEFQSAKGIFATLSDNEQTYINSIYQISRQYKADIQDINNRLLDFVVYVIITDFENKNKITLNNINNFRSIIQDISQLFDEKKEISRIKLKNILIKNINTQLTQSKQYSEMLRIADSSRKWSITKFVDKFQFDLLKGIRIWLMTPETISEALPLTQGLFDYVVFDEASQIYIEKSIPAITRAKKVVISGDHKQLRPSSLGFGRIDIDDEIDIDEDSETNPALEEDSLLDLARFKYPQVMLNYHYRAKYEELINFSNYAFYKGKLNVSPNIITPAQPPIEVKKINNGLWHNRCNQHEAIEVVKLLKEILNTRSNNETIGIITFNSNQRDCILDIIDKECINDQDFSAICKHEFARKNKGEDIGLFVKNIENVQGDERDIIVFSTGYAINKEGKFIRNFGWLNQESGENRLNVAISRAKQKIHIVTSFYPEELHVDDLKNNGPKLFKKYLEYCFAVSNRNNASALAILNTLTNIPNNNSNTYTEEFINIVYNALTEQGLHVEKNIGVGDYKIDLAIIDPTTQRYLLGIEIDTTAYTSPFSTRERDIYKNKYLTSRGWKIHRLWSPNWWHNQKSEINKILKLIK